MSHYNVKPVASSLTPSRQLKGVVASMHVLCLLPVFLLPIHWGWQIGIISALIASLIIGLRQLPGPLRGLNLAMDGAFFVRLKNGEWVPAEVLGSSFVKPWLTILHLRLEGRRFMSPLVLLPDMLAQEDFRRLRMWLLWGWKSGDDA